MFRVLQESLTNVHRHSQSRTPHIRLFIKQRIVTLEIRDAGVGIPAEFLQEPRRDAFMGAHVGLRSMAERMLQIGGRLEVISARDGTIVKAVVPVGNIGSGEESRQNPD